MDINLSTSWIFVLIVVAVWELAWKGVALWHASQRDQRAWFVVLLVINSAGLLPIIYLLLHRGSSKTNQSATVHENLAAFK